MPYSELYDMTDELDNACAEEKKLLKVCQGNPKDKYASEELKKVQATIKKLEGKKPAKAEVEPEAPTEETKSAEKSE